VFLNLVIFHIAIFKRLLATTAIALIQIIWQSILIIIVTIIGLKLCCWLYSGLYFGVSSRLYMYNLGCKLPFHFIYLALERFLKIIKLLSHLPKCLKVWSWQLVGPLLPHVPICLNLEQLTLQCQYLFLQSTTILFCLCGGSLNILTWLRWLLLLFGNWWSFLMRLRLRLLLAVVACRWW